MKNSGQMDQRWINLTYAFIQRMNNPQITLQTLRDDYRRFLGWYQPVRDILVEFDDKNSLLLPDPAALAPEQYRADLSLIIRNNDRDQLMIDRFWRGGYFIEFVRSINYKQAENHTILDSLLLGLQTRLPN